MKIAFSLTGWRAVFSREFTGYFATPVAYVYTIIFVACASALTFYVGNFFARGEADLQPLFQLLPWIFLFFGPAVAMRLWSEERRLGTAELLLTLPITTAGAVWGKFLAAWAFTSIGLFLTATLWLTVNFLGDPDNGVILANYVGAWLLLAVYLAIGSWISALTRAQVLAFVATVLVCFLFLIAGLPLAIDAMRDWAPAWLLSGMGSLSIIGHVDAIARGVLDIRDMIYFILMIGFFLTATVITVNARREQL
jgi:ABC-2 type transport system permease protein